MCSYDNAFWSQLRYSYLMTIFHTRPTIQQHIMLTLDSNYELIWQDVIIVHWLTV
jgi:hypothetical protein